VLLLHGGGYGATAPPLLGPRSNSRGSERCSFSILPSTAEHGQITKGHAGFSGHRAEVSDRTPNATVTYVLNNRQEWGSSWVLTVEVESPNRAPRGIANLDLICRVALSIANRQLP